MIGPNMDAKLITDILFWSSDSAILTYDIAHYSTQKCMQKWLIAHWLHYIHLTAFFQDNLDKPAPEK